MPVQAQWSGQIRLHEVIPALKGSELGELGLGPAPPPGGLRVVRRDTVLRALKAAGRSVRGLRIPAATRIRRAARRLSPEELRALIRPSLESALGACTLERVQVHTSLTLAAGEVVVETDLKPPRHSGRLAAALTLRVGEHAKRLVVPVQVRCPEPAVSAGKTVRIVAVVGSVRASAMGVAKQAGRVGDTIRVTTTLSQTTLLGKVVDGRTVEVQL